MTTREDFVGRFKNENDAFEFENRVLSIGREFLPPIAQKVLDGKPSTPEYWTWLCHQLDQMESE